MELSKKQSLLIKLLGVYNYSNRVAIPVSLLLIKEQKFQDLLIDNLTERRLSEEELLQLMADYIRKEHPLYESN